MFAFHSSLLFGSLGVKHPICDSIKSLKGVEVPVTRETNFNKMDQAEFAQFYDKVVDLILTRLLPGVGKAHLEAQVIDILDGRRAA